MHILTGPSAKHERVGSALPQRQFIDLDVAHKQSQKAKALSQAEQRMMKRAKVRSLRTSNLVSFPFTKLRFKDLQNLIELDVVMYDILDLPPLNEYELYIRNYGTSNTVQVSRTTRCCHVFHAKLICHGCRHLLNPMKTCWTETYKQMTG